MIGETLFTCQPQPRQFLIFKWTAQTHSWVEIDRWKTPLHYGTAFHTQKQCTKCWEVRIETVEAYGP